jgi:hypothetical protein
MSEALPQPENITDRVIQELQWASMFAANYEAYEIIQERIRVIQENDI